MYKNELWENDNYSHNPEVVSSNLASATKGQVWYRYIACTILRLFLVFFEILTY